ncbi:unnamed protein product [Penicillium pancosmium]
MAPRAVSGGLGLLRSHTKARDSKVTMIVGAIGVRVTNGEEIMIGGKPHRRLHLQICKGAEDVTLKGLANKDPNKKWSHADVPMNTPADDRDKVFDQIWVDFEANMVD